MKVSSLLGAVVLSILPGCQPAPPAPEPKACTMIGCSDGITVVVENAPAPPYTVEVILPDGTSRTSRCEAAPGCDAGLFFEGVTAEELTVRVTAGAGSSSEVVHPTYHVVQPNGPGCPPICKQARVQVRYAP
ncbi:MAG TPA: hypothetical protein VNJ70_07235 [Thermoanaerobaculia bacterium]|nr:hypothetical protein [Thermoanaerobaculia bacterium]